MTSTTSQSRGLFPLWIMVYLSNISVRCCGQAHNRYYKYLPFKYFWQSSVTQFMIVRIDILIKFLN